MTFEERKQLALKFFELAHSLDTVYLFDEINSNMNIKVNQKSFEEMLDDDFMITNPNELSNNKNLNRIKSLPMQICDVKLDNFGLNEKNELMIIDTDMIHPDKYIFFPKVCHKHDDCSYFDCKSYCDSKSNRCITSRINNNLQSICQNILNNSFEEDGIISGIKNQFPSNVKNELFRRLKSCQNPGNYNSVKFNALSKLLTYYLILNKKYLVHNNYLFLV
jgi:hypothetical protein